jgi:phosphatidylglycerophosphate synthase
MIGIVTDAAGGRTGDRGRAVPWEPLLMALVASLLGCGLLLADGWAGVYGAVTGVLVAGIGCLLVARFWGHRRLGRANGVTLARLVGTSWLAALGVSWLSVPAVRPAVALAVAVACCCLALDGVDGKLARSDGEASDFGARFDFEVDAAMIMILCVAVAAQGGVGWWVLAIGLLRYGYWLTSLRLPVLTTPIAPSKARKAVAVAQGVALVLCLAFTANGFGPAWLPSAFAAIALAGLVWSFASETVHRLQAARAAS